MNDRKYNKLQLCVWEYASVINQKIYDVVISGNEPLISFNLACNWWLYNTRLIERQVLLTYIYKKILCFLCWKTNWDENIWSYL